MNQLNNLNHNAIETAFVVSKKVSCNGLKSDGSSIEGHPLVYLDLSKNNSATCPYCSRFFTLNKKASRVIVGIKHKVIK
jgi:uncharacterized Zn-finger protein